MRGLVRRDGQLEHHAEIMARTQVPTLGGATGLIPINRRNAGAGMTLIADRNGAPLAVTVGGEKRGDQREIAPIIQQLFAQGVGIVAVRCRGPDKVSTDARYESEQTSCVLRFLGIEYLIRKRWMRHGSHRDPVCKPIERSTAWLSGFQRLRLCYDGSQ